MSTQPGVDDSRDAVADVVVRVPTHESQLRSIRLRVRDFVSERGGDDDLIRDIVLAVSELATNVMQHSAADSVTVAMRRLDAGWQIDVYDADEVPSLDDVVAPANESVGGRGLVIVQALMNEVSVVRVGDHTIVRCVKLDD